jgi:hypothetical protein
MRIMTAKILFITFDLSLISYEIPYRLPYFFDGWLPLAEFTQSGEERNNSALKTFFQRIIHPKSALCQELYS